MNRRDFVRLAGSGVAAGAIAETAVLARASGSAAPEQGRSRKALMKAGTQHGDSDASCACSPASASITSAAGCRRPKMDEAWSVESLTRLRERVESFGLTLDMVPLPLSSNEISRSESPAILLGKEPDREQADRRHLPDDPQRGARRHPVGQIQPDVHRRAAHGADAGPRRRALQHVRLCRARKQDPPLTDAGPIDADLVLGAHHLLPRSASCRSRRSTRSGSPAIRRIPACRSGKGWRGVETVLGSVDGLKRFVSIAESPYHGLNFCQGTVSEMLEKPGEQIFDVIRYFGTRGKIFNVHFRNIAGGFLNFRETFIDDGDVDMLKAMRVYKEVGYDGMMMPDHVPPIEGDENSLQGFAFAFGYIKALIAAVSAES